MGGILPVSLKEIPTICGDEENTLNDDLKNLEFYPLVSLGLSYKF